MNVFQRRRKHPRVHGRITKLRGSFPSVRCASFLFLRGEERMKNTVLNQKQRDLVNEYYEFSKTVVASSFHFADGNRE